MIAGEAVYRRIVALDDLTLAGGAKRERVELSCGHAITRAIRRERCYRRTICLECSA